MRTDNRTGYVFCGGTISEGLLPYLEETVRRQKKDSDQPPYVVAADCGLVFLEEHGMVPDLAVGDFDSSPEGFIDEYRARHPETEIRTYDPEKDYTDSEIGARAAVSAGCGRVVIIGGTGTRIDHMLGNLQVLSYLLSAGVRGEILDSFNRISMYGGRSGAAEAAGGPYEVIIPKEGQWGKYVSLFAFGGDVAGLTLEGFHYTVKDFLLSSAGSRAVSNEIDDEKGRITFSSGKLLVVESRDVPKH